METLFCESSQLFWQLCFPCICSIKWFKAVTIFFHGPTDRPTNLLIVTDAILKTYNKLWKNPDLVYNSFFISNKFCLNLMMHSWPKGSKNLTPNVYIIFTVLLNIMWKSFTLQFVILKVIHKISCPGEFQAEKRSKY